MKAVITGTPVQIEGEPAEIAQLVELLSSGAVMVEHVHHWRLGLPDDDGIQQGTCWCGTEKAFAPFDASNRRNTIAVKDQAQARTAANVVALGQRGKPAKIRTCKRCGVQGHDVRKCPQAA